MKTRLNFDAEVTSRLKREGARQWRTVSKLVEAALRHFLRAARRRPQLPELRSFHSGGKRVDIADRGVLHDTREDM